MTTDAMVSQWRPALIKVTAIGNPEVAGGEPQAAYIDPSLIAIIYRAQSRWYPQEEDAPKPPLIDCTTIQLVNGNTLSVLETAVQINRLRDEAYGLKEGPPKLEPVK